MSCLTEVLLACYQGERYLASQLDSILNQSDQNFRIIARDDNSSDNTQAILESYANRYPKKIIILPSKKQLGVVGNFNALLEHASAEYLFFSDQDDIWEPNKIEICLEQLKNADGPTLVHTDLIVVDANLNLLQESFWRYSGLNPEKGSVFNRLLVQNHATGCTIAINRALKEHVYPIPKEAIMHDWWMSLVASALGNIVSLPNKTILYRQHGQNVLGARQIGLKEGLKRLLFYIVSPNAYTPDAELRQKQAKVLFERFEKKIPIGKMAVLEMFLRAPRMSVMERKWNYLAYCFCRQGLKKTLPYLLQNRPF